MVQLPAALWEMTVKRHAVDSLTIWPNYWQMTSTRRLLGYDSVNLLEICLHSGGPSRLHLHTWCSQFFWHVSKILPDHMSSVTFSRLCENLKFWTWSEVHSIFSIRVLSTAAGMIRPHRCRLLHHKVSTYSSAIRADSTQLYLMPSWRMKAATPLLALCALLGMDRYNITFLLNKVE